MIILFFSHIVVYSSHAMVVYPEQILSIRVNSSGFLNTFFTFSAYFSCEFDVSEYFSHVNKVKFHRSIVFPSISRTVSTALSSTITATKTN